MSAAAIARLHMSPGTQIPARRHLGRTEIEITPIGLGTWQFSEGRSIHGLVWSRIEPHVTEEIVAAALAGRSGGRCSRRIRERWLAKQAEKLKANDSYLKVQSAVRMSVGMMENFAGGREMKEALMLPADRFMLRWTAD